MKRRFRIVTDAYKGFTIETQNCWFGGVFGFWEKHPALSFSMVIDAEIEVEKMKRREEHKPQVIKTYP